MSALPPEQNLIVNGDFRQPLTNTWEDTGKVDQLHPDDPLGAVAVVSGTNGYAALFQRTGTYHAETDLTQFTHTDVLTGFHSVKLYFDVQVDSQDVPLCGSQGSECPMMVQLDYQDSDGKNHSYFQGFYAVSDDSGINPTSCILCETHNEHIKVPAGVPWPFETGNLLPLLSLKQITAIRVLCLRPQLSIFDFQCRADRREVKGDQLNANPRSFKLTNRCWPITR